MDENQQPRRPAERENRIEKPPPLEIPSAENAGGRKIFMKQTSGKYSCLCSPTTHVGSFRCRQHRNAGNMRSSASVGSGLASLSGKTSPVDHTVEA
ncbi:hypothetical protein ACLOJK_041674 [Asimina triloba]